MSGGSDSTTTKSSGVPDWAVPYAQDFLTRSQQVADQPYQAYQGQTTAQMNPYQTAGYNAQAQRAIQGSAVNDAASTEVQKTLSGGYLGSNPYLNSMVDAASGDVTRNYSNVVRPQQDALAARSGSFGNSGVQQTVDGQARDLAGTLGNISTNIRGADYSAERNRMSNAVNQAPTIANQDYIDASALQNAGGAFQAQEQRNLLDDRSRFDEAKNYPKDQLATLGKGLGMNYGGSTTTSGPGSNGWAQALGAAATAYGAYSGAGGGRSSTSGGSGK